MHSATIAIGVLLAGIVSGATGLAFPLIAAPIFLLDYAPPQAILVTALCSLIGQLFSIGLLRQSIAYELRWRLILAGLIGVPFGTAMLIGADEKLIRFGLGGLLMMSSMWCLAGRRIANAGQQPSSELAIGISGGICAGMVGVSSAVPAIWLSLQGLDKTRQRAIMQPYIIAAQCTSLLLLCYHGTFDATVAQAIAVYLAPVLAGVSLGAIGFRFLSHDCYSKAVAVLTLMSGFALVLR